MNPNVDFLAGEGEMATRMRAFDWTSTPLGRPEGWPSGLRTALRLLLNSHYPMHIFWGPQAIFFYNDGFVPSAGPERHPSSLGRPASESWGEVWPIIGAEVAKVRNGGGHTWYVDQHVPILRGGVVEDAFWTYGFSPIDDDTAANRTGGVISILTETTRRKNLENSLRVANAALADTVEQRTGEFDALWNASIDLLCVADFQGNFIRVNPAWSTTLGWSTTELVETPYVDLLHPDDREISAAALRTVVAGRSVFRFENRYRCKDGSYRWLSWNAAPKAGQIFAVIRDVTEEKVQSEALRLYEHIVQSDTAPICAFDTDLRLIAFNQAHSDEFFRIYGCRVKIGDVFPDLFLPDQAPIIRGFMERALTGEAFTVTEEFGDPNRAIPYWEVSYNPLKSADGRVVGAFHHATDITARLRAQAALRATETRATTYFKFSNDYLFLVQVDAKGVFRFQDMNPACERAMGLVRDEIVGREVDDVLKEEAAGDINRYGRLCLETRQSQSYLAVRQYREGRSLIIDGRVTFIEREEDESGLLLFSGTDVTEQRLVEEQLRQAQKMEAVGQLTGGLAHDFNNLLTGMMGNLELLQLRVARGRLDDLDRLINAAQGAGRRAAALTQRLLAFSRRQTLDPKPIDVNRLIAGLADMLQRTVGASTQIEVVGAAGLWTALVDAAQLENAILNLCINGRDAMPEGGRLTIETANKWIDHWVGRERDLTPGQYISICVTDTGTGMSPETIARAFEPFYTTKPLGQGTGLGLSMIYGFAKQSGGQVRIYSEVGQGTTVCIYLPRHHGKADELVESDAITLVQSPTTNTVLVVDDEPTIRHLIDEVLDELGYTVIGVADGAAAIKVLESGANIELLITDVGLPNGMNGRQVADAARVLRPRLKVLFITGFAENAAIGNGHLEPGMELLTKPFTLEALSMKAAEMLKTSQSEAPSRKRT